MGDFLLQFLTSQLLYCLHFFWPSVIPSNLFNWIFLNCIHIKLPTIRIWHARIFHISHFMRPNVKPVVIYPKSKSKYILHIGHFPYVNIFAMPQIPEHCGWNAQCDLSKYYQLNVACKTDGTHCTAYNVAMWCQKHALKTPCSCSNVGILSLDQHLDGKGIKLLFSKQVKSIKGSANAQRLNPVKEIGIEIDFRNTSNVIWSQ